MPDVPRLFPGDTFCLLGAGPSLTRQDCESVRGKARVIAINKSYQLAPWADVLYAADTRWWKWHKGAPEFAGLKYSLSREAGRWPGVQVLTRAGETGLCLNPSGLAMGRNGGYQAINLAVHLGAKRILLLGYDMKLGPKGQQHWHPAYPHETKSPYRLFARNIESLKKPLEDLGIACINCTRDTNLGAFPRMPLEQALETAVAA